jgi:hypothetical protein
MILKTGEMKMDIEKFNEIVKCLISTKLTDLKTELFDYAIRYARIRTDWYLASDEKRRELGDTRTRAHDALIDSCNILSRNMAQSGEENTWRINLGTERKEIGDFACYVHYFLGINAR